MFDQFLREFKDIIISPFISLFIQFHPITISYMGLGVGMMCGWALMYNCTYTALFLWALNRLLDNLDGAVARKRNLCTDLGGHLDIVFDFYIYCAVPICIAIANPSQELYIVTSLLISSYTVNAVSLFHLASILEKKGEGAKSKGEVTTITMPTSLIEGGETGVMYTLFIVLPGHSLVLFSAFFVLVFITTVHRLHWASKTL
eukprot:TRINITY_DN7537_c0_g1_i1.p1 TRINITY_DN7537_c0_g1~~TRINITY_DN7537_c0_g1_i1.p1  ORF type:complete len:202 (+),score=10.45 TRINITY_DN7537_c0_g1_i1:47-652(+)